MLCLKFIYRHFLTWSDIWWPQKRLFWEADVKRLILIYNLLTHNKERIWPRVNSDDLKTEFDLKSKFDLFPRFSTSSELWCPRPIISGNCLQERHLFMFHLPSSIERKFRPFLRSKASFWFKFLLAFEEFEIWTSHLMTPGLFFWKAEFKSVILI